MAAQIAAGQVIDSPAAVVRELVENALDAQATRITVQLWPEVGQIQVADNGHGIAPADLPLAAAAHSTNKIRTQQDLWQVNSLGFRGQALHSLAQAGQLTLCSRLAGTEAGYQVAYSSEGDALGIQPIAMAPGTIATLAHLFAAWPSRQRGLPTQARQLRALQQVIYHCALCHPQVTWTVRLGDRPWFSLTPGATAKTLLPQMLTSVTEADLRERVQPIPDTRPPTANGYPEADRSLTQSLAPSSPQLYGLIGLPDRCHRPRADWVKVAVNGRLVTLPELEQSLIQTFRHTLPRHRYPLCFLHLRVNPQDIDWNRCPDKSALYLQHLDQWIADSQQCLDQLLRQHPTAASAPKSLTPMIKTAEAEGTYAALSHRQVNLSDPLPGGAAGGVKALAQVHNRYILAEQVDGLCLIEQHIAHERVLYEQLQDHWQVVALAQPVVLSHLTEAQQEQLQRLGLSLDPFGPHRWAIRSIPAPLRDRPDLAEALLELSHGHDLDTALVAISCRTAIRNGTPLSLAEMQALVQAWQRTRRPRTCPHGRPICLTLTESSLARFFRRHWVIGKSHGLE